MAASWNIRYNEIKSHTPAKFCLTRIGRIWYKISGWKSPGCQERLACGSAEFPPLRNPGSTMTAEVVRFGDKGFCRSGNSSPALIRRKVTEMGQASKTNCRFREERRPYRRAKHVRGRHIQRCSEGKNLHRSFQCTLSFFGGLCYV